MMAILIGVSVDISAVVLACISDSDVEHLSMDLLDIACHLWKIVCSVPLPIC